MAMAEHGSSCWSKTEEWLRVIPNELALGGELGPNPKSNKYDMTVETHKQRGKTKKRLYLYFFE